jgi:nitrogen fixation/metabolism regulation signal transduction histidine kinase
LAHEIKNPLTPIQLSAERLQMKLADRLSGADAEMLDSLDPDHHYAGTGDEKRMVNDFSDYARMPAPELAVVDLNALVVEVLGLYETSRATIEPKLAAKLPPVWGDTTQLRQIIHNLLRNAEDAQEAVDAPLIRDKHAPYRQYGRTAGQRSGARFSA